MEGAQEKEKKEKKEAFIWEVIYTDGARIRVWASEEDIESKATDLVRHYGVYHKKPHVDVLSWSKRIFICEGDEIALIARAVKDEVMESVDERLTSIPRLTEAVKTQEKKIEAFTEIVGQLGFDLPEENDARAVHQVRSKSFDERVTPISRLDEITLIARAVTDEVMESVDERITSISRLTEAVKAQEKEIEALTELVRQLWFSENMPGDRRAKEQEKLWQEAMASKTAEKSKLEEC